MPLDETDFLSHRVEAEAELGKRSFNDFYKMAWSEIDPEPYIDGKHARVICYHLQLAARREISQLVICIPPRHTKSLLCSVAFPAWVWTWWPSAKFITCSYDMRLAGRDSMACRRLVESPWYQQRWPHVKFVRDQNQKLWYQTTAGGVRYVGSPRSGVTGHGADYILHDDPHDYQKAESVATQDQTISFQFETLPFRFNNPDRGVSIVIQQRVNERDVAGECIRRGWYPVILPARFEPDHPNKSAFDWRTHPGEPLWPERFGHNVLNRLWRTLNSDYAIASQQQQRPHAREGTLFKRPWFGYVDELPTDINWVRAWDLAGTDDNMKTDPDYTAGVKIGWSPSTQLYYIAHVVRDRLSPAGVETLIKSMAELDGKNCKIFIPQDPGQAGKAQAESYVKLLAGWPVHTGVSGKANKMERADPFAAQCEHGNVKLYRGVWAPDFVDELCGFPTGSHDDQVDAASSGFTLLSNTDTGLLDFVRKQAQARQAAMNPGGPTLR